MILAAALAASSVEAGAGSAACERAAVRGALVSFVAAFNGGDYGRLDTLFARPPLFRWYSSGAPGTRLRAASTNRATLVPYFRDRHRKRDRLRLVSFRFTGNTQGSADSPGSATSWSR